MKLLLSFMVIMLSASAFGQSDAIAEIIENEKAAEKAYYREKADAYRNHKDGEGVHPDSIPRPKKMSTFWIYPSVLRAVNINQNELWNDISVGLERAVYLDGSKLPEEVSKNYFTQICSSLGNDGFEPWVKMSGAQFAALFVKENNGVIVHFVALGLFEGSFMIVDFEGELTPDELMQLKDINKIQEDLMNSAIFELLGQ